MTFRKKNISATTSRFCVYVFEFVIVVDFEISMGQKKKHNNYPLLSLKT